MPRLCLCRMHCQEIDQESDDSGKLRVPEEVAMARPTGVGRAGAHLRFKLIPIEGADDREAATIRTV
jgi:hypothetical protein